MSRRKYFLGLCLKAVYGENVVRPGLILHSVSCPPVFHGIPSIQASCLHQRPTLCRVYPNSIQHWAHERCSFRSKGRSLCSASPKRHSSCILRFLSIRSKKWCSSCILGEKIGYWFKSSAMFPLPQIVLCNCFSSSLTRTLTYPDITTTRTKILAYQ